MPSLAYSKWAWVAVVQRLLLSRTSRATQKTIRKTKFLVKLVVLRSAECVQRSDRNPVHTMLKRNVALAIARWIGRGCRELSRKFLSYPEPRAGPRQRVAQRCRSNPAPETIASQQLRAPCGIT